MKDNRKRNSGHFTILWTIIIILLMGIVIGYFMLNHPYFSLTNVEIKGNKTYSIEDFKRDSKIIGKNYFLINLDKAKDNISRDPRIVKVELEKKYPNTVIANIIEKVNIAYIVNDKKDKVFIDTLGNISQDKGEGNNENLPEIVGVNTDLIKNTSIFNDPDIKQIYDNILKYKIEYSELNLVDKNNLFIVVDEIKVDLGNKKEMDKKFEVLSKILSDIKAKDIKIKNIKLSNVSKPLIIEE
ncbi:FtsQ-type POTRA domain-containing protein [Lagierella sp.]|uniref:cell division protein FtsQ/DivIB n=1 Tax=Lagierella sp. TaxID=2849657 RepID=UPI002603883F|nr:FtsQ-type POTRA domain-containing protein [Lagierella sp.]